MKKLLGWSSCLVLTLVFAGGCNQKETQEGGPGATPGPAADGDRREEATFTLNLPDGVNANQEDVTETSITLDAGDNFNQQVRVTLEVPAGVTIEPAEFTLSPQVEEQKLNIRAAPTAREGDVNVGVIAKPATGAEVRNTFRVTVDRNGGILPGTN